MAVPDLWRTQKQRYSLQAATCSYCSNAVFPPRAVCPYCRQPMAMAAPKSTAPARDFVVHLAAAVALPQPALPAGDD